MKNFLSLILLLFFSNFFLSQTIQFVSSNSGSPLPQVFIYDVSGKIITESDIDGKINVDQLKPFQEKYILYYENYKIGELTNNDLNKDNFKLNDRVKNLELLSIIDNTKAKFIYLKGNFNTNVTINGYTNAYADGMVTHVFDNQKKKYLYTVIDQYRVYKRTDVDYDNKILADDDFGNNLRILTPKILASNLSAYKKNSKDYTYNETSTTNKDVIELKATRFDDKIKKILGYWFTQAKADYILSYDKESKRHIRDFIDARVLISVKIKRRVEPEFHQMKVYQNFYATDLSYGNQELKTITKFKHYQSYYKNQYWNSDDFPKMTNVLNNFYKGKFEEKENKFGK